MLTGVEVLGPTMLAGLQPYRFLFRRVLGKVTVPVGGTACENATGPVQPQQPTWRCWWTTRSGGAVTLLEVGAAGRQRHHWNAIGEVAAGRCCFAAPRRRCCRCMWPSRRSRQHIGDKRLSPCWPIGGRPDSYRRYRPTAQRSWHCKGAGAQQGRARRYWQTVPGPRDHVLPGGSETRFGLDVRRCARGRRRPCTTRCACTSAPVSTAITKPVTKTPATSAGMAHSPSKNFSTQTDGPARLANCFT